MLHRTAARYRRCDRFTRYYVASKLRMDPVNTAVLALAAQASFGRVMDLGSGRGQLGVALLEAGLATGVLAVDQDANALRQLGLAAAGLGLRTLGADLAGWTAAEHADTVLLIDVLYQLPTGPQLALLNQAAASARQTVIIRASDPARGWRSRLSTVLERLGRGWWPTFGARYNALPPRLPRRHPHRMRFPRRDRALLRGDTARGCPAGRAAAGPGRPSGNFGIARTVRTALELGSSTPRCTGCWEGR